MFTAFLLLKLHGVYELTTHVAQAEDKIFSVIFLMVNIVRISTYVKMSLQRAVNNSTAKLQTGSSTQKFSQHVSVMCCPIWRCVCFLMCCYNTTVVLFASMQVV